MIGCPIESCESGQPCALIKLSVLLLSEFFLHNFVSYCTLTDANHRLSSALNSDKHSQTQLTYNLPELRERRGSEFWSSLRCNIRFRSRPNRMEAAVRNRTNGQVNYLEFPHLRLGD